MSSVISKIHGTACVPGGLPGGLVRTRFFDGMLLSQADLENEQVYWRMKRRLTNRALGEGVVWGLRAAWNATRRELTVTPGYALDCCGNDLVVECATTASLAELIQHSTPEVIHACKTGVWSPLLCPSDPNDKSRELCLVLQYVECPEAPVAVHRDACSTVSNRCEPSRVRETTRLLLVPPPKKIPGPLDDFCARIEALRDEFADELEDDSVLVPAEPAPAPTPGPGPTLDPIPAFIDAALMNAAPLSFQLTPGGDASTGPSGWMPIPGSQPAINLTLRTDSGWSFVGGRIIDAATNLEIVDISGVLGTVNWNIEADATDLGPGEEIQIEFKHEATGLLIEDGSSRYTFDAHFYGFVYLRNEHGTATLDWKIFQANTSEPVRVDVADPDGETCCSKFEQLIFTGDPTCTVKAWILAVLYAWLRCQLEDNPDATDEEQAKLKTKATTAQLIYVVAWKLMFGFNAGAKERARLVQLLEELFATWCELLMYPGPRCTTDHHGIYLGCFEFDERGRVTGFDPWAERRYVVTGPLLAHWGAQFGLASIDTIVGRLAQTICCVANDPLTAEPVDEYLGTNIKSVQTNGTIGEKGFGFGGRWPIGNSEVYVGNSFDLGGLLARTAFGAIEKRTVGMGALEKLVAKALTSVTKAEANASATLYSVPSADIHLLVPDEDIGKDARPSNTLEVSKDLSRALPPLARAAVAELSAEISAVVTLRELAVKGPAEATREVTAKLEGADIRTVSDLLEAGPEAAAAVVDDNQTDLAILDGFLQGAENTLAAPIAAARDFGNKGPLTRKAIARPEFLKALAKQPELASTNADLLETIASRVAGETPKAPTPKGPTKKDSTKKDSTEKPGPRGDRPTKSSKPTKKKPAKK